MKKQHYNSLCIDCQYLDRERTRCFVKSADVIRVETCDRYVPAPDQTAKADEGKLQITLVPTDVIRAIARIRMYGNQKYHDPDNWKTVEPARYRDALMRHLLAYIDDPKSKDEESGLPHLWHAACNMLSYVH